MGLDEKGNCFRKDDIHDIKITLAKMETDLRHHIRRTDLLQDEVKHWRKDLKPIQTHVAFINGLSKLLLVLAAVAGAIAAIMTIR